jgi:hypothetical protein
MAIIDTLLALLCFPVIIQCSILGFGQLTASKQGLHKSIFARITVVTQIWKSNWRTKTTKYKSFQHSEIKP